MPILHFLHTSLARERGKQGGGGGRVQVEVGRGRLLRQKGPGHAGDGCLVLEGLCTYYISYGCDGRGARAGC